MIRALLQEASPAVVVGTSRGDPFRSSDSMGVANLQDALGGNYTTPHDRRSQRALP